ncbi:MAG: type II toxin-antitoxin system RelE/ParE family toxin [Saprospiraceae bacterium]|nr:type II toxin-antitoxin system RelE/ParE family toxin [Saprospiraceae bacterium]
MSYRIVIKKKAIKLLEKINERYYTNIKKAIIALGENPRPKGYKKLHGRDGYRIRVDDYRIIYEIFDDSLLIDIINLGHRKEIYD